MGGVTEDMLKDGSAMTDRTLSPAAQAVWNADLNESEWDASQCELDAIAAALRAAADQMGSYQSKKFLYSIADAMKLRDIATELKGAND